MSQYRSQYRYTVLGAIGYRNFDCYEAAITWAKEVESKGGGVVVVQHTVKGQDRGKRLTVYQSNTLPVRNKRV